MSPPPSTTTVASGSSRSTSERTSCASQACWNAATSAACSDGDVALPADWSTRRRAGGGQLAARLGRAPHDRGDLGERVVEDVVEDEGDALGRRHRLQHDQEGHVHRLVEGHPIGRVDAAQRARRRSDRTTAAVRGSTRRRSARRRARADFSWSRHTRLATVVNQAPGDSIARCSSGGERVPTRVRLLHGVLGLGQRTEQPVADVEQVATFVHHRAVVIGVLGRVGHVVASLVHLFDEPGPQNVRSGPDLTFRAACLVGRAGPPEPQETRLPWT